MENKSSQASVSVDSVSGPEWDTLLGGFADASVYQSAAYGAARWGEGGLSRLVLKQAERVTAVAQARIVRVPLLPIGIAYVGWGPAWRRKGNPPDLEVFRLAVRALREEYAVRRRLFLRIVPNVLAEGEHPAEAILREEGFEEVPSSNRTILLDLAVPPEELRSGLRRRWRQTLDKAEKAAGVEWIEGAEAALYESALDVYREMHQRKQFAEFVNKEEFRVMQAELPAPLKMRILIGKADGVAIAAMAWSVFGETGLPLLAATGRKALENDAAYVMWWRMLLWMKQNGFRACDLGGINPERNPGGYTFKSGLAKKHGKEVRFVGEFGICTSALNRTAFRLAKWGKDQIKDWKLRAEKLRRKPGGRPSSGSPPPAGEKREAGAGGPTESGPPPAESKPL